MCKSYGLPIMDVHTDVEWQVEPNAVKWEGGLACIHTFTLDISIVAHPISVNMSCLMIYWLHGMSSRRCIMIAHLYCISEHWPMDFDDCHCRWEEERLHQKLHIVQMSFSATEVF